MISITRWISTVSKSDTDFLHTAGRRIVKNLLIRLGSLAFISPIAPFAAEAGFIALDPTATPYHTNDDSTNAATAYSLASLSLTPGQTITLMEVGTYSRGPSYTNTFTDLNAVFSSSTVLLDMSVENRVPDAIGVGVNPIVTNPTYVGSDVTDIPNDFYISRLGSQAGASVTLVIPTGAAYIFFSAADVYFHDNISPDNNFGVNIGLASVPEPASLGLAFLGIIGTIVLASWQSGRGKRSSPGGGDHGRGADPNCRSGSGS
jgi:hypothetical protein